MNTLCVVVAAFVVHLASAQPFPPGGNFPNFFPNNGIGGAGNLFGGAGLFNRQIATCSARTPANDLLRVTIQNENPGAPAWAGGGLRLTATITSLSATGSFQLAISQFGRVEDGCYSQALGAIFGPRNNMNWWNQFTNTQLRERGILGSPFTINAGQTATLSEVVTDLTYDEILGNAVMLCNTQLMSNGQCMDPIPLCCKLGKDSQAANQPIPNTSQLLQNNAVNQGGIGLTNPAPGGLVANNNPFTAGNTATNNPFGAGLTNPNAGTLFTGRK